MNLIDCMRYSNATDLRRAIVKISLNMYLQNVVTNTPKRIAYT